MRFDSKVALFSLEMLNVTPLKKFLRFIGVQTRDYIKYVFFINFLVAMQSFFKPKHNLFTFKCTHILINFLDRGLSQYFTEE